MQATTPVLPLGLGSIVQATDLKRQGWLARGRGKQVILDISTRYGLKVESLNVSLDHIIQLLLSLPPTMDKA